MSLGEQDICMQKSEFVPLTSHHVQKLTENESKTKMQELQLQSSQIKIQGTTLDLAIISCTRNKRKNRQTGYHEIFKNLCFKGQYQQNKKATHRMGENICKSYI